jgi:hypothetical protein
MPYTIHEVDGILRVVFRGTFVNHDLSRGGDELDRIERSAVVVPHRISDMRPVERLEIDFAGVLDFALARRRLQFKNSFKSAIIAPDVAHFGFARMYQILIDHPQILISIFGDEESALVWLRMPGFFLPAREWQPSPTWAY